MIRNLLNSSKNGLTFLAPMVRYSRLPFRLLCRKYGTDVVYSPMFIAEGFSKSQQARDADFMTSSDDTPLIVQFAAKDPVLFLKSSALVANSCAGVDLNCGCPQKWAMSGGLGCEMLNHPDIIQSCVETVRSNIPNLPVSVKIRICTKTHETAADCGMGHLEVDGAFHGGCMHRTLELVRTIERAGADFITIHGRTAQTSSSTPVCMEAIKMIKEAASIPIIGNGDIFSDFDVQNMKEQTNVDGFMSARGLLQNPSLFYPHFLQRLNVPYEQSIFAHPPISVFTDFVDISSSFSLPYKLLHNHIMLMAFPLLAKGERDSLAGCTSPAMLHDFLSYYVT
ncbi:putative tRNA-dihydrouridine synthase B [Blattamonas nauphoetae]|uniref:tRNA-dihydrouridine synthase B n=1 Tax=Blattamonas nauphoetae TaxID=2049346 RepID=A0ABQ9YCB3_9EUKA|nr:putative tRNA-dihydrouridine synthase B [Blattamonas nauphoetae]